VRRRAGAWRHAPGCSTSDKSNGSNESDEPNQPDEPDEPDQPNAPNDLYDSLESDKFGGSEQYTVTPSHTSFGRNRQ
jgi:hypothetical protein